MLPTPRYPHQLLVTKPGAGGTQDPATGRWTPDPGGPAAVYDGACDAQDAGEALEREATGSTVIEGDVVVFLDPDEGPDMSAFEKDLPATVTWEDGTTESGAIHRVRRMDQSLVLKWV